MESKAKKADEGNTKGDVNRKSSELRIGVGLKILQLWLSLRGYWDEFKKMSALASLGFDSARGSFEHD